jgi:bacterioferritin-associated ferredoxin
VGVASSRFKKYFHKEESMDTIICRCEEIAEKEILEAMQKGLVTLNEIKKATRAGMGLCQGKICMKLIERIVTREKGIAPQELPPPAFRPPVRPLPLSAFKEHPVSQHALKNEKRRKK